MEWRSGLGSLDRYFSFPVPVQCGAVCVQSSRNLGFVRQTPLCSFWAILTFSGFKKHQNVPFVVSLYSGTPQKLHSGVINRIFRLPEHLG